MEFSYRKATYDDLQGLRQVGLAAYGTFQPVLSEEGWNRLNKNLQDEDVYRELMGKSTCIVCVLDEKVIGMAYYVPNGNPTDIYPADWCYVRMVGVLPDFVGKGIGKELMRQCVQLARDTNEKTIGLHTSEFMDAARHIYEKMGFVQVKELAQRFGKRYWLYSLEV